MTSLQQLLVVQEHDTVADQLRHRRDTLPQRTALDQARAALDQLDGEIAELDEERQELDRRQKRLEDEVASLTSRISEVDRTLYSGQVTVPKELQALQQELESLRRRQRMLEDQELEIMELSEPLDEQLEGLRARRTTMDSEAAALADELVEVEQAITGELGDVESKREEAVAGLPDELLTEYERLRTRLAGIGVAPLNGNACGGCHLMLSAVEVDRIKREPPDALIHCEECGRLLVR